MIDLKCRQVKPDAPEDAALPRRYSLLLISGGLLAVILFGLVRTPGRKVYESAGAALPPDARLVEFVYHTTLNIFALVLYSASYRELAPEEAVPVIESPKVFQRGFHEALQKALAPSAN